MTPSLVGQSFGARKSIIYVLYEDLQRPMLIEPLIFFMNFLTLNVIWNTVMTVNLCLFSGTIFAYGQTGTGKTFTMEGMCTDW